MKIQYLFPILLTLLDIASATVYAFKGDGRMAVYWVAAAVLNICVTLGGK